jgi:hypothetical protein
MLKGKIDMTPLVKRSGIRLLKETLASKSDLLGIEEIRKKKRDQRTRKGE